MNNVKVVADILQQHWLSGVSATDAYLNVQQFSTFKVEKDTVVRLYKSWDKSAERVTNIRDYIAVCGRD